MTLLLELETPDWQLEVTGHLPELPPFIVATNTSTIRVSGDAEVKAYSRSFGQLVPIVAADTPVDPLFFEQVRYDFYLKTKGQDISIELPPAAELRHHMDAVTHYTLNFLNDIGYTEIKIKGSQGEVKLCLEVFPQKIDYRTDYVQMRDEVAAIVRNLVISVQARTFGLAVPKATSRPTLPEWFSLLQYYMKKLSQTGQAITDNPHSQLMKNTEMIHPTRTRYVDNKKLAAMLRRRPTRSGGVLPNTALHLPTHVPEIRQRITFDTPENRYFKALLLELQRRLQQLMKIEVTGDEDADLTAEEKYFAYIRPVAVEMAEHIRVLLTAPFLREVTAASPIRPNSMVLHRHPHYAAFEKWARLINGGLSVGGAPLQIGLKNIATLYEYWCFLKFVQILSTGLKLEQQSLVRIMHLKTTVVLQKGQESTIRFRDPSTGKTIFIVYNRLFAHLPTLNQRPDNVIELASEDRFFIFDAKYRLSFDQKYQQRYGGIGPQTEDINTMHRYRDAIALPHPVNSERYRTGVVTGAVVLFPFPDEEIYEKHRFFKSIKLVQIGGLPFLPSTTRLVTNQLLGLLQENGSDI